MIDTHPATNTSSPSGFLNPEKILEEMDVIEEGSKVADFGCGSGYFALPLAKIVGVKGVVYAIDILPSVIEVMNSKIKQEGLHNIQTIHANLETPGGSKLEDTSVDYVLLANILYQSKEKKIEILNEAKRILKNDGKAIVIGWDPQTKQIGPFENFKISSDVIRQDAMTIDLKLERAFNIDPYHYCLIFTKK